MGLKDWLDEVNEQMYEDEREEARERYKNKPEKLARALRRIDARAKPGAPWGILEQEPDLATMDKAELEELRDTLEVEIEEKERALSAAREYGETVREVFKEKPESKHGSLLGLLAGALGNSELARRPVAAKRALLAKVNARLRNLQTPPGLPAGTQASKEQKKAAELEAVIKEKEHVLASASPDMRPYIERLYREKVEKIMDS